MPEGPAEKGTLEYAQERLAKYENPTGAFAKMAPAARQRKVDKWRKEVQRLTLAPFTLAPEPKKPEPKSESSHNWVMC